MPNKVFVLTGATSGIGKALATDLARTGETLVMVAREAGRGSSALKEITLATQNRDIDLQLCDLPALSSVRNLAEILKSRYEKSMSSSTMPVFINERWVRLYEAMNTGMINVKIMK